MIRKANGLLSVLIILLLALLYSGCGRGAVSSGEVTLKKWTILLYLNGDEDSMQNDFIAAFHDIVNSGAGSTDMVNIVSQFDRYIYNPMPDFGRWTIAHRFYLKPGMEPTEANAVTDWGDGQGGREVDMADTDVLSAFIKWAVACYPAEHYLLLIGDHGYGWQGMNIDMTSFGRFTSLVRLREALANSQVHFDILALDACVMQMAEVAHELRNSRVDYLVASENLGTTWPLAEILEFITKNPQISSFNLGKKIVDLYQDSNSGKHNVTLSVLDMKGVSSLSESIQSLRGAMIDQSPFTTVQEKAQAVVNLFQAVVLYARSSPDCMDEHGLSIYFPPPDPEGYIPSLFFYNYTGEVTSFAVDIGWRDFLFAYFSNNLVVTYPIPPQIYHIRMAMQPLDDDKIDLYDFCQRIVNWQD